MEDTEEWNFQNVRRARCAFAEQVARGASDGSGDFDGALQSTFGESTRAFGEEKEEEHFDANESEEDGRLETISERAAASNQQNRERKRNEKEDERRMERIRMMSSSAASSTNGGRGGKVDLTAAYGRREFTGRKQTLPSTR